MDWRTRLDETRAPFNFYYLTLSGSGGDVDKVSIRNCRFRPRLCELRLLSTSDHFCPKAKTPRWEHGQASTILYTGSGLKV